VKLCALLLANSAEVLPNNALQINGTIDQVRITPDRPLQPGEKLPPLPIPRLALITVMEFSLADGLRHVLEVEIVNEDERLIVPRTKAADVVLRMNPQGRQLRHNQITWIEGLFVPGPGDYSIRVYVGGQYLDAIPFYVDLMESRV
jgi:hypothetical protein